MSKIKTIMCEHCLKFETECVCPPDALRAQTDAQSVDVESLNAIEEVLKSYELAEPLANNPAQRALYILRDMRKNFAPRLQGVPDGYVIVPIEPTEEMEEAADTPFKEVWEKSCQEFKDEIGEVKFRFASGRFSQAIYKAMIAAAQTTTEEKK